MVGPYFSFNGILTPVERGVVPLDDIDYAYGYGIYETLKVRHGLVYFPDLHEDRLRHSAKIIGFAIPGEIGIVGRWVAMLADANRITDCNIKILAVGRAEGTCDVYIICLNPLFPDRVLYKSGAALITYQGERHFPQAKSLSMLVSTIAYRAAVSKGAYDALLVRRDGAVTEGTRTNFFAVRGPEIVTAPFDTVLEGVTKLTLMRLLKGKGIPVNERMIEKIELDSYDGFFLTSTSSKVIPVTMIDDIKKPVLPLIRRVMELYDEFLKEYALLRQEHRL